MVSQEVLSGSPPAKTNEYAVRVEGTFDLSITNIERTEINEIRYRIINTIYV